MKTEMGKYFFYTPALRPYKYEFNFNSVVEDDKAILKVFLHLYFNTVN